MSDGAAATIPGAGAPLNRSGVALWRAVCLISLSVLLALGVTVYATGVLPGDVFISQQLIVKDTGVVTELMRWVNYGGRAQVLVPAAVLLFWLSPVARRDWWLWCVALIVAPLLQNVLKFVVGRPRPNGSSLGFPSGDATAATAFAMVVIYVVSREDLGRGPRWALSALAVCLMLAVGLARIMRHAHWPSDVLGGLLLGAACTAAVAWWESSRSEIGARRTS